MVPVCASLTLEQGHSGCNSLKCQGREEWDGEAQLKNCIFLSSYMIYKVLVACVC